MVILAYLIGISAKFGKLPLVLCLYLHHQDLYPFPDAVIIHSQWLTAVCLFSRICSGLDRRGPTPTTLTPYPLHPVTVTDWHRQTGGQPLASVKLFMLPSFHGITRKLDSSRFYTLAQLSPLLYIMTLTLSSPLHHDLYNPSSWEHSLNKSQVPGSMSEALITGKQNKDTFPPKPQLLLPFHSSCCLCGHSNLCGE